MLDAISTGKTDASLPSIAIFNDLDQAQFDQLSECFHITHCSANRTLIQEGEDICHLHIVIHGHLDVKLSRNAKGYRHRSELLLARLGPGDLVGEYGFVDHQPASATVLASEDCDLLTTKYSQLHRVLGENPELASRLYYNLLYSMVQRLRSDDSELKICIT